MNRIFKVTSVFLLGVSIQAQVAMTKPQVANQIRKVEDGVDEFKKYLERRGDNARDTASNPQAQQSAQNARGRRGTSAATTDSRRAAATQGKDQLNDNLDALNRSTNRLRRKFDATDKWIETKVQVEAVVDDARKLNTTVTKGSYGSEVARIWAALRTQINELARMYNVTPLGV